MLRVRHSAAGVSLAIALVVGLSQSLAAQDAPAPSPQKPPMFVLHDVHHEVSPPLREMRILPIPRFQHHVVDQRRQIPLPPGLKDPSEPDPALQTAPALLPPQELAPTVNLNFEGLGAGFTQATFNICCAPPDTNGAVGTTQYVQWVNTSFAIFDKTTGNIIGVPMPGNQLWQGFSDPNDLCRSKNRGDPIVTFDKLAQRWVFSQFAFSGTPSGPGPFLQCVAVSQTSDATGAYNLYEFQCNAASAPGCGANDFNDYPKMGVWPDGYYETFNLFPTAGGFAGTLVCAYDRTAMLAGNPATEVCFIVSGQFSMLPSDFDGTMPPPAGAPNQIGTWDTNAFDFYPFHVDFVTPSNSTIPTTPNQITVPAFSPLCGGNVCIPQPGIPDQLDSLGDFTMYRLAYRNFGDHESWVVDHSVVAGTSGGVRWYEFQRTPGNAIALSQASTFAPDTDYRWMGSVAMDRMSNMALGYTISSSATHPSVAITGRLNSDTPNTMEAETIIASGTASQSATNNRWGDYSAMQVDPSDDCTFWFTSEYIANGGTFNWSTRIASFKFPNCGAPTSPALRFVAATPCRIADTRLPNGPFGGPFLTGNATARGFTIPNSVCGIPNTALAYSLNVTVVPHTGLGFLTMFPCGGSKPFVSTLNSLDGRIKAAGAIVPAGTNPAGAVCAFASNDTDLVLDINGYFIPATDPTGMAFFPVTPCRMVDTRLANGPLGGPMLVGNATGRTFPLQSSSCGIPNTAVAYSLNMTAVPQGPLGFLTTWPTGQTQPLVSTLNALTGTIVANAAIVPAGTNGSIDVFVNSNSHVVIDVNGYFAPMTTGGLSLFTLAPCRALDTRNPSGSQPFNGQKDVNIVASVCGAPATAQAFVLNATVVPPGGLGFLTLWPQGAAQPFVSTLNATDGAITSNMAIVPTTNGKISAFGSNPTHLVLDISSFFAP